VYLTSYGANSIDPACVLPGRPSSTSLNCKMNDSATPKCRVSLGPRILSGSVGSIITALAVTPLEVVKIRQQSLAILPTPRACSPANIQIQELTLKQMSRVGPCPSCGTLVFRSGIMECVLPMDSTSVGRSARLPSGAGTFRTLLAISRQEGLGGLYKGLGPTLIMGVPNTVLYFTAYDYISMQLNGLSAMGKTYTPLIAGSSARLLASFVTAPLELIRTRQASVVGRTGKAAGMGDEFRLLLRSRSGFRSLFSGIGPTLWRDVPFSAIYWYFVERFRADLSKLDMGACGSRYYEDRGRQVPPSIVALQSFISGASAGSIAAAFTTPFDVVKTRRQTATLSDADLTNKPHNSTVGFRRLNTSTFGHMRRIATEEGLSGLWRGNATRMAKVAPACAIMISSYEFGKIVFTDVI